MLSWGLKLSNFSTEIMPWAQSRKQGSLHFHNIQEKAIASQASAGRTCSCVFFSQLNGRQSLKNLAPSHDSSREKSGMRNNEAYTWVTVFMKWCKYIFTDGRYLSWCVRFRSSLYSKTFCVEFSLENTQLTKGWVFKDILVMYLCCSVVEIL